MNWYLFRNPVGDPHIGGLGQYRGGPFRGGPVKCFSPLRFSHSNVHLLQLVGKLKPWFTDARRTALTSDTSRLITFCTVIFVTDSGVSYSAGFLLTWQDPDMTDVSAVPGRPTGPSQKAQWLPEGAMEPSPLILLNHHHRTQALPPRQGITLVQLGDSFALQASH